VTRFDIRLHILVFNFWNQHVSLYNTKHNAKLYKREKKAGTSDLTYFIFLVNAMLIYYLSMLLMCQTLKGVT